MLSKKMEKWATERGLDLKTVSDTVDYLLAMAPRAKDPVIGALLMKSIALQDSLQEFKEFYRDQMAAVKTQLAGMGDGK